MKNSFVSLGIDKNNSTTKGFIPTRSVSVGLRFLRFGSVCVDPSLALRVVISGHGNTGTRFQVLKCRLPVFSVSSSLI